MDQNLPGQPIESISNLGTPEKTPDAETPNVPIEVAKDSPAPTPAQPVPAQPVPVSNIIDLSAGTKKTKPVASDAQKLTAEADKEEEEFIEDVEQIHTIKP